MMVVLKGPAQARFKIGDRLPEAGKVGVGQLRQRPPGLISTRIAA